MGQAARRKKILAPLEELGLHKINAIEAALKDRFGESKAREILSEWERLSAEEEEKPGAQNALYEYLNSDYDLAMLTACYTDAAIIRGFCLWLYDHREAFAGMILDVGCGIGVIACFLGKILPQSRITAVDRSANAIRIARQVQEKMGVSNVMFVHMPAEDIPGTDGETAAGKDVSEKTDSGFLHRTFDTVFSSRTFHENIGIRFTDYRFLSFSEQVRIYENIYREYTSLLCSLVSEGGNLICIERNHMDTEYYAFLKTVEECGFCIREKSLSQLECEESDFREKSVFECFIADRMETADIDNPGSETAITTVAGNKAADAGQLSGQNEMAEMQDKSSNAASHQAGLFEIWSKKAFYTSDNPAAFTRPQTDYYLETHAGDCVEEYGTYDPNGTQLGRAGIWKAADDSGNFLLYQANYGRAGVKILSPEQVGESHEVLADHRRVDQANGFTVKEFQKN